MKVLLLVWGIGFPFPVILGTYTSIDACETALSYATDQEDMSQGFINEYVCRVVMP